MAICSRTNFWNTLAVSKLYTNPKMYSAAWNFGPNQMNKITVEKIVQNIIKIWNKGDWIDASKGIQGSVH